MSDTLPVTPEALQEHLDIGIRFWRIARDDSNTSGDWRMMARCYIDAYQSVRITFLGSLLEGGEPDEGPNG